MGDWFVSIGPVDVMLVGVVFFAALYLLAGSLTWWLSHHVLPACGFGRTLDTRPLPPQQLRREIGASAISILIFGTGLIVPWGLLQLGWARLAIDPSAWRVLVEIVVLFFWNELHFYANHRLLHTPRMRRFHSMHHRSHIATPFSTYSFHPVEALLLGGVPLIPMLLHDFSFVALLSLPIFSVLLNNLGHSNYEFSRKALTRGWRAASRRHHLHHVCYHGNYGFLLEVFDRWAGTALPLDAADARLARRSDT